MIKNRYEALVNGAVGGEKTRPNDSRCWSLPASGTIYKDISEDLFFTVGERSFFFVWVEIKKEIFFMVGLFFIYYYLLGLYYAKKKNMSSALLTHIFFRVRNVGSEWSEM